MKKNLLVLISIIVLALFIGSTAIAQDKKKVEKKAKTEQATKEVSKKCAACPSFDTCKGDTTNKIHKKEMKACKEKK